MNFAGQISLQPTTSDVTRLNAWLDRIFVETRFAPLLAADLKLCLNEVVANLIGYGLKDTANPQIFIEITLRPGLAKATIRDNGAYFDIRDWRIPKERDLMSGDLGGFGVALIRERASRLDYGRVGGLNQLEITCEG